MKLLLVLLSFIALSGVYFSCVTGQSKTKSPQSLNEKVQTLLDMNAKRSVLKLNGQKYKDFVKSAPRNYSMIIMFTAMAPARQCVICRHAHDEFTIAANSYRHSNAYSNKLFFAMIDFDEGSDVFQQLRLNTAPVFMHFPAKGKPKGADTMDIQRIGFSAELIAKWIHERTDVQIRIFRPPNYSGSVAVVMLFSLVAGFLYMRRNNLEFLYNKQLWGILSVLCCFIFVSGQMWNHIRSPPFIHKNANGVNYIHGSSQGQLIVETYIVMFLNAMIVIGMIMLTEVGNQTDPKKGRILAIVGLVLVSVFFSSLLSVFRTKAQGYPYSFLFK